jgi:hypothetical protein
VNRTKWCFALCMAVVVAGCSTNGGEDEGSGLPPDTRVDALSVDQKTAVCDWADRISRKHDVDCGQGITAKATHDAGDDCREDLMTITSCAVTIEQLERCYRAAADQACVIIPAECQVFMECE